MAALDDAKARLQTGYYNSASKTAANPGGLANDGHVTNFPGALADVGLLLPEVSAAAAAAGAPAGNARWQVVAGDLALAAGGRYAVDTSALRVLTLPALADVVAGDVVEVVDLTGQAAVNKITVNRAGADAFLGGLVNPIELDVNRAGAMFIAEAAGWRVIPQL